jgi:hypothetical protein
MGGMIDFEIWNLKKFCDLLPEFSISYLYLLLQERDGI